MALDRNELLYRDWRVNYIRGLSEDIDMFNAFEAGLKNETGRWVYTKDTLPRENQEVIVSTITILGDLYSSGGWRWIEGEFYPEDGMEGGHGLRTVEQGGAVYAWMPLPDPAPEVEG